MESCRIGIPVCREWAGNLSCLILEGKSVVFVTLGDVTYNAAEPVDLLSVLELEELVYGNVFHSVAFLTGLFHGHGLLGKRGSINSEGQLAVFIHVRRHAEGYGLLIGRTLAIHFVGDQPVAVVETPELPGGSRGESDSHGVGALGANIDNSVTGQNYSRL